MAIRGELTLVAAAIPEEIAPLSHRLDWRRRIRVGGGAHVVIGRLGLVEIALVATGDGKLRAEAAMRAAVPALEPARIYIIGLAGGLDASLESGALVVGEEVRALEDGGRTLTPPAHLVSFARRAAGAAPGTVLTADALVLEPEDKSALRSRLGSALAAVVDLESYWIAAIAEDAGRPWVVLRAVSDVAGERLPSILGAASGADGSLRRGALVRRALVRPDEWPKLLRLRARARGCAARLADAVTAMERSRVAAMEASRGAPAP